MMQLTRRQRLRAVSLMVAFICGIALFFISLTTGPSRADVITSLLLLTMSVALGVQLVREMRVTRQQRASGDLSNPSARQDEDRLFKQRAVLVLAGMIVASVAVPIIRGLLLNVFEISDSLARTLAVAIGVSVILLFVLVPLAIQSRRTGL